VIWHVVDRVSQLKGLDQILLVTPVDDAEALGAAVKGLPVTVCPTQTAPLRYHADGTVAAWDVLGAFAAATASLKKGTCVLRVTGDCPAWSPEAGALTLDTLRAFRHKDAATFTTSEADSSGWPDGVGSEAFWVQDLRRAADAATWPADREHVTRWMHRNLAAIVVANPHGDFGHLKLSVDTPWDLTCVRQYLRAAQPEESR
jgi:spore coat polysaccharide biosynthesis protein SpsF